MNTLQERHETLLQKKREIQESLRNEVTTETTMDENIINKMLSLVAVRSSMIGMLQSSIALQKHEEADNVRKGNNPTPSPVMLESFMREYQWENDAFCAENGVNTEECGKMLQKMSLISFEDSDVEKIKKSYATYQVDGANADDFFKLYPKLSHERKEKSEPQIQTTVQRENPNNFSNNFAQSSNIVRKNKSEFHSINHRTPQEKPRSTRTSFDNWDDYRESRYKQNDQTAKVNPFRTALEFDRNVRNENAPENEDDSREIDHFQQHSQRKNNAFPVKTRNDMNISSGLKRKFRPPIKGVNQNKKPQPSSVNSYQKWNISASAEQVNQINNDDDESLPEELKHLDKELVQKIMAEILSTSETITFQDIAGLENAKQTIQELVIWPMRRPDLFTGLRKTPNGVLLFGPPGTGKTLIGKAIAHESKATFFSISSSSLTSKWIGEGEKLVRALFTVAAYREPSVVFIDEIDSLLTQRKSDENEASRRIKTEFLVQFDGTGSNILQHKVLIIGATNRPEELDDAARRRFVKRIYVPLPQLADRSILLQTLLNKNKHSLNSVDIQNLANDTEGFSGADLKALCTDAALWPIRSLPASKLEDVSAEDVPPITYKHFRLSLRGMKPSVCQEDLKNYMKFDELYGSKRMLLEEDDEEYSNKPYG